MKRNWFTRAMAICLALCLCFSLTACRKVIVTDSSYYYEDDSDLLTSDTQSTDDPSDETNSDVTDNTDNTDSSGGTSTPSGNNNNSSSNTPTQQPSGGGLGADTGEKLAKDKVVDMKGYNFTILSAHLPTKLSKNSTLFEENLFTRIKEVEKQYNCKITILNSPYPDMETIQTYVAAGKKVADLLELSPYQMVSAKELGYIVPWDNCSDINVDDPRWCDSYTKLGFYDGKQYGLQFYRPEEVRYCVVFNKTLLKANGIDPEGIYDMVENGTWTFDKFQEICVKITKDTNNDGKTDQFGFCGLPNYISWGLIGANGGSLVKDSGGKVVANFTDSKVVNALNYYDKWVNTQKIMYTNNHETSATPWDTVSAINNIDYFLKGNCGFLLYESWVLNQQIKPRATFDYGMVPYPKGPDATTYTSNSMNARLMCLTTTNKNADKTAIIFNALARPVDDQLDWADDVQADYFQSNDSRSLNMYDLCLRNVTFDKAYAVNSVANTLNAVYADTIFGRVTTPSAKLSSIGNTLDDPINELFNK